MDKQKAIEEMSKVLTESKKVKVPNEEFEITVINNITPNSAAITLANAGYGNIRQALTEFTKRLTEDVFPLAPNYLMVHGIDHRRYSCKEINRAIYKTLEEFLDE